MCCFAICVIDVRSLLFFDVEVCPDCYLMLPLCSMIVRRVIVFIVDACMCCSVLLAACSRRAIVVMLHVDCCLLLFGVVIVVLYEWYLFGMLMCVVAIGCYALLYG